MSVNITAGALACALLFSGGTTAAIQANSNAFDVAQYYVKYMSFSKQELIEQLSSSYGSGFSEEEAKKAVDRLEKEGLVDWDAEAIDYAQTFIENKAFSKQALLNQLTSKYGAQFTEEQASNAIAYLEDSELVNWYDEALEAANLYVNIASLSKQDLYNQLTSSRGCGFTRDEADYALAELGF